MTNPHLKKQDRKQEKKREGFALPVNSWEVQSEQVALLPPRDKITKGKDDLDQFMPVWD